MRSSKILSTPGLITYFNFFLSGNEKYCALSNDLEDILENGTFSDITLQVQDKQFSAHKTILACRSKVFKDIFIQDNGKNGTNTVVVKDIEPSYMACFLQYIYTGDIDDFSVEKAQALFTAAEKYGLQELRQRCLEMMLLNITVKNVCQIAVLAHMHSESKLIAATTYVFRKYKHDIFQGVEWNDFIKNKPKLAADILQVVTTDFTTNAVGKTHNDSIK